MRNSEKTEYKIEVVRAYEFDDEHVAFDMVVNGITIYGCNWIEGTNKKGELYEFVAFPSKKGKDDKYYNHVWFAIDDELLDEIGTQIEKLLKAAKKK